MKSLLLALSVIFTLSNVYASCDKVYLEGTPQYQICKGVELSVKADYFECSGIKDLVSKSICMGLVTSYDPLMSVGYNCEIVSEGNQLFKTFCKIGTNQIEEHSTEEFIHEAFIAADNSGCSKLPLIGKYKFDGFFNKIDKFNLWNSLCNGMYFGLLKNSTHSYRNERKAESAMEIHNYVDERINDYDVSVSVSSMAKANNFLMLSHFTTYESSISIIKNGAIRASTLTNNVNFSVSNPSKVYLQIEKRRPTDLGNFNIYFTFKLDLLDVRSDYHISDSWKCGYYGLFSTYNSSSYLRKVKLFEFLGRNYKYGKKNNEVVFDETVDLDVNFEKIYISSGYKKKLMKDLANEGIFSINGRKLDFVIEEMD